MDGMTDWGLEGKPDNSGDEIALKPAIHGAYLNIPGGEAFLSAEFIRQGYDLTLDAGPEGSIVIPDYFLTDTPSDVLINGTSLLSGDVVARLAGPMAPGQYAQEQQSTSQGLGFQALGEPIGSVTELEGAVTATHADGVQVTLNAGDPIFQGDVVETGANSSIGVIFADDTTFSLDADGSMIMDEMVYDPDTQTGVFEATVVKGVFTFVSGQVAKTGADAMVVNTPKTTIGIRGSTGLVKSGVNGGEDKITLIPDIDGNVGELFVFNQGGSQVLNQPNASTIVFSPFQSPAPVVFLTPQQIQQDYGSALSVLVRTEARKAQAKAEQAARQADEAEQKATQQKEEAQKAEEEAAQADEDAAAASADAEAAAAEVAAAKAEAEAAANAEAKAVAEAKLAAAEAKAAEAEAKAAAESEAAATKAAEAAAKAEAAALAEQQAAEAVVAEQDAQQFNEMAGTAMTAQQQAFDQFVQAPPPASTPEGGKAMIYISQTGEAITVSGDTDVIVITEGGNATTNPTPTTQTQKETVETSTEGDGGGTSGDDGSSDDGTADEGTTSTAASTILVDDNYVDVTFADIVTATVSGGTLSGGSGNTNFYFPWATLTNGTGPLSYTITDAGGTNQISLDGMSIVYFQVTASTDTAGSIAVYKSHDGSGAVYATVSYSGISQFLLSNVTVSSFSSTNFQTTTSGNVLKLSGLSAGQVGYGIAGDAGNNSFTISTGNVIAFGNDGDDTFNINTTGTGGQLFGGVGADTFRFYTFTTDWEVDGGSDGSTDVFDYSTWGSPVPLFVYMDSTGVVVQNTSNVSTPTIKNTLKMDGTDSFTGTSADDFIHINGGTYGVISGNGGNDTFSVAASMFASSGFTSVNGDAGASDTLIINVTDATALNLASHAAKIDVATIESVRVTGVSSQVGINVMGLNTSTTLDGSGHSDTLAGGTAGDIIQGQHGADSLSGGGGADTFVYYNKLDAGDTISDYVGDSIKISTTGDLGLLSKTYDTVAWGGTATALNLNTLSANVIVLSGTAGTLADAMAALAAGNATATNAIVVFRDSASINTATLVHTDNLAGNGTETVLTTMTNITADLTEFTTADFTVSA